MKYNKKELVEFLAELKRKGGHCLQIVKTADNRDMVYYRNYGDYVTQVHIEVF